MNESGKISSVIEDHVEGLAILESLDGLLHAPDFDNNISLTFSNLVDEDDASSPDVFLLSLTLPGEDGNTGSGDSSSGLVLGGEDLEESQKHVSSTDIEQTVK